MSLTDSFFLSILMNGLYPPELKIFVKEFQPAIVTASLDQAKVWEACHYNQCEVCGGKHITNIY